ncbi:EAL domain-containing protein [Bacillus sp. B1-b2]|uniref:EAL domain-containing protein n=1 Tax=Bacillus sp. B1-b2 TaxID=2653201 RepID=UPI001261414F|nr:EAL domain-containing protein [Bacillus sp. B1-b2]KAB7666490.1 EAL domain-containing protein [Bacillus sp. B1-b2]
MNYQLNLYSKVVNWSKLFLPAKTIKYFPPNFVLRDSIVKGVGNALKSGMEVVVVVFDIHNLMGIKQQLEEEEYINFIKVLKKSFRDTLRTNLTEDELIAIHDYNPTGITMFIKLSSETDCIKETDSIIRDTIHNMEKIFSEESVCTPIFNVGYMFIEKKYDMLIEAVHTAQELALSMAKKKEDTEFNKLVYALSEIVAKKDINLLAQPIMDVETNKIHACEMLTRGPKGTALESPLRLFSIARQTKFLYDLEMIVLEKAYEQIQLTKWQHSIFINFTPVTIGNPRFIKDIKKVIKKYNEIPPKKITIEVTERDSFEDLEYFSANLKVLRVLGFRIAVDDTGAGYASLNSISEIMPDIIKIDRSVIQNIDKNSVKESMLKGLLLIAKEVGSVVVAEGIESAEEASILSKNKVDLAQGYFYARPTNLSEHLQIS